MSFIDVMTSGRSFGHDCMLVMGIGKDPTANGWDKSAIEFLQQENVKHSY